MTPDASQPNSTRALAAIMFSDIAGYTLIMGRDEQKAISAITKHREVLRATLPKFDGQMVGEIGDGTLTSFHSALDAVNCALEVQAALGVKYRRIPDFGVHDPVAREILAAFVRNTLEGLLGLHDRDRVGEPPQVEGQRA